MYWYDQCVSSCVGGASGAKGKNLLIRANGEMIDLGGKECASVQPWVSSHYRYSL